MATYIELRSLFNDTTLRNRVTTAVIVAAQVILENAATETAERIAWAQQAIQSPEQQGRRALMYALAANKDLDVLQIQDATDAALQANVDDSVNGLATGLGA